MRGCAVVVGATGSMGSAFVARLVRHGVPVVAVARGQQALADLAAVHPDITTCVADISENSAIDAIAASLTGPVRMALFCAGLPFRGSVDVIDPDLFAVGANVKVAGMVRLVRAVHDRLVPGSRLIAVAGSLGLEPSPHEAGPGAINAALFNLMRQYSAHYGPLGITTHTVSPGPTDTPRLRRIVTTLADERGVDFDAVMQTYLDKTSLGRLPTLDEIAWVIDVLLAPEADVLHGSVIKLDCGTHRFIG
jgi:NAD(P)-dependent dehydrogenase (short-subunit alcohol dehydrogenase family)